MDKAAGIQIEQDYIVAAVLHEYGGSLQLLELEIFNDSSLEERQKKLASFWRRCHMDSYKAGISTPARNAILRKFGVPFAREEQIDRIIHFESERYMPSRPIEDLLVDYHVLKRDTEHARLLVGAIPRKVIGEALEWVEWCGITRLP